MERFTVIAELRSPLVLGGDGYFTLDGLLAGLLFERLRDVEAAHGALPLASTGGLFHASAAMIEPYETRPVSFVANLRAQHDLDPGLLLKNKHGRVHRRIGMTRRQDFGAVMNSYRAFGANEICWYAEGDAAAVNALVKNTPFIGKRRAGGFGEVSRWTVEPDELDGVTGPFGEPMRPVPVDLFRGDTGAPKAEAAWRPAYWHPANRAVCYVPGLPR